MNITSSSASVLVLYLLLSGNKYRHKGRLIGPQMTYGVIVGGGIATPLPAILELVIIPPV